MRTHNLKRLGEQGVMAKKIIGERLQKEGPQQNNAGLYSTKLRTAKPEKAKDFLSLGPVLRFLPALRCLPVLLILLLLAPVLLMTDVCLAQANSNPNPGLLRVWDTCPKSFKEFGKTLSAFNNQVTAHFRQKTDEEIADLFNAESEEADILRLFAPFLIEPMGMAIFHLECWADYRKLVESASKGQRKESNQFHSQWRNCLLDGFRESPLPKGFQTISKCYSSLKP